LVKNACKVYLGDCRDALKILGRESIDLVITSPPYWSLRDYKIKPAIFGGQTDCRHRWENELIINRHKAGETNPGKESWYKDNGATSQSGGNFCSLCGAWRGQLGLEPTPELFIKHLLEVFDLIKPILKGTGSVFVNLGDTYSNSGSNSQPSHTSFGKLTQSGYKTKGHSANGLPPKCLCMIPFRFAMEMVNRGWVCRNVLIWHMPNCIPSSARDRFTVDFEYLFFFTKNSKYYFEQQFEPIAKSSWNDSRRDKGRKEHSGKSSTGQYAMSATVINSFGRNKRSVWKVPTHPFKDAHFATYPPALIEPIIKAGCPQYVCRKCGKPREKIYKGKSSFAFNIRVRDTKNKRIKYTDRRASEKEISNYEESSYGGDGIKFAGYTDCGCNSGWSNGITLDPFAGSGTTLKVANELGRDSIGIEINPAYVKIILERLNHECEIIDIRKENQKKKIKSAS
jgi:DNA modification methylase